MITKSMKGKPRDAKYDREATRQPSVGWGNGEKRAKELSFLARRSQKGRTDAGENDYRHEGGLHMRKWSVLD